MTITTTTGLNVDRIYDLIRWAEQDSEAYDKRTSEFAGWGRWNQGLWGQVSLTDDALKGEETVDEEELKRLILNGVCQTSFCMAGQAVVQSDYRLLFEGGTWVEGAGFQMDTSHCIRQVPTGRVDSKGRPIMEDAPDAEEEYISEVAARILGIDSEEADRFFSGDNDLDDLKEYANTFAASRGLPPLFAV